MLEFLTKFKNDFSAKWSIKIKNLCELSARKISKISQIVRLMLPVSINLNSNLIEFDFTSDFRLSKNIFRHLMALKSTKNNAKLAKSWFKGFCLSHRKCFRDWNAYVIILDRPRDLTMDNHMMRRLSRGYYKLYHDDKSFG